MIQLFLKLTLLILIPLSTLSFTPGHFLQKTNSSSMAVNKPINKKNRSIKEIDFLSETFSFDASPAYGLIDQQVKINVYGLPPGQIVRIQAEATDHKKVRWKSFATFQAAHDGTVSLTRDAPIQGTYHGVDSMGLFWSLKPEKRKMKYFKPSRDNYTVNLSLLINGSEVKTLKIWRFKKSPEVRKYPVSENGLVGALFLPPSKYPLPAVITLNGFHGGMGTNRAQLLASHGFAVLALGYCGFDRLPSQLENIPLEYFEKAFAWLKEHPSIDAERIGLYGISRGAELSLILGSLFPEKIHVIVATVPSSTIFAALGENKAPAWTYQDKPIGPFVSVHLPPLHSGEGATRKKPITTTPYFLEAIKNNPSFEDAAILVENIRSPLLFISGGKDQMWPSSVFAKKIEERLSSKDSKISYRHLHYPNAGHQIGIPYLPTTSPLYYHPITKLWFSTGGSAQEDDFASRDSWHEIIDFFHKSFIKEKKNNSSSEAL